MSGLFDDDGGSGYIKHRCNQYCKATCPVCKKKFCKRSPYAQLEALDPEGGLYCSHECYDIDYHKGVELERKRRRAQKRRDIKEILAPIEYDPLILFRKYTPSDIEKLRADMEKKFQKLLDCEVRK